MASPRLFPDKKKLLCESLPQVLLPFIDALDLYDSGKTRIIDVEANKRVILTLSLSYYINDAVLHNCATLTIHHPEDIKTDTYSFINQNGFHHISTGTNSPESTDSINSAALMWANNRFSYEITKGYVEKILAVLTVLEPTIEIEPIAPPMRCTIL